MVGRQVQMIPAEISAALFAVRMFTKDGASNSRPKKDFRVVVRNIGTRAVTQAHNPAIDTEYRCACIC